MFNKIIMRFKGQTHCQKVYLKIFSAFQGLNINTGGLIEFKNISKTCHANYNHCLKLVDQQMIKNFEPCVIDLKLV